MRVKFGDILNLRHVDRPSTAVLAVAGLALGIAEDLKMTFGERRTAAQKRLAARAIAKTTEPEQQVQTVQLEVAEVTPVDDADYPLAA